MDFSTFLLDLLIVLAFAKLAAEVAERLGIPAVVGEILAGILIGPSVLGWVGHGDEALRTLGELGVILLLLDVGLEMDIGELRKVGRASLTVATIGVVVPMVLGIGAMRLMGEDANTALFVGAALTATSVGITARVFGDLRALATSEARIVLGAAVADDVMGLVVLTVVVRMVTEGSVSAVSVAGIIGVALLFLLIGGAAGVRIAPGLFQAVNRLARSSGTLVALAFAFGLGFARLAGQAKLAPIVGAFVAGLALGRTDSSERIRGELAPIGHLLIPVFFVQIGLDADVGAFTKGSVLVDAGILLAVAVVGKLVAAAGVIGTSADKPLVGLGMLPRGEVGLIFATIGLAEGVLNDDLYAALLLVVLATTLMTPPLLKQRSRVVLRRAREAIRSLTGPHVDPMPVVADGEVLLPGPVDDDRALELALRAAILARSASPHEDLVAYLAGIEDGVATGWDDHERELLLDVIERGNARSWRFLEATGTLDRALPELAHAMRLRRNDPLEMDLDGGYRWKTLERLRVLDASDPAIEEARQLEHPNRLLVAALLVEALDPEPEPERPARALVHRVGWSAADADEIVALVEDRHLLWAAARRSGALDEHHVRHLAGHLRTPERARATYVLAALASDGHERWERARLAELHTLVQDTLVREAPDTAERDLVEQRRAAVARLVGDDDRAVERALAAPSAFTLAVPFDALAAGLAALDPLPPKDSVRVRVDDNGTDGQWRVTVAMRDRPGVLAGLAGALTDAGYDIRRADVATWPDGAALELFTIGGTEAPDPDELVDRLEHAIGSLTAAGPIPDVTFTFDNRASPWHTVCEIEAGERPALLADLCSTFRAAGVSIRTAAATSHGGRAFDTFELVRTDGGKLDAETQAKVRDLARSGVTLQRRRFRAPALVAAGTGVGND